MAKSKKRNYESISRVSSQPSSSPLTQRARKHNSSLLATSSDKHLDPFSIAQPHSVPQYDRSDGPSPSTEESEHRFVASKSRVFSDNKRIAVQHRKLDNNAAIQNLSGTPQGGPDLKGHTNKSKAKPSMVVPPVDPKRTTTFIDAIRAQSKQRSRQYQTFTATIPSESSSDSESVEDLEFSSADVDGNATVNGKDDLNNDGSTEMDTGSDSDITSSTSTASSSDTSARQELDNKTKRAKDRHRRPSRKPSQPKSSKSCTKPAMMGRALDEDIQRREKEKIDRATKRAIANLIPPSSEPPTQNSLLSKIDEHHLLALRTLLPSQLLTLTRAKLLPDRNANNTANNPASIGTASNPTEVSLTLATARHLILQLSNDKLGTSLSSSSSFSLSDNKTTDQPPPSLTAATSRRENSNGNDNDADADPVIGTNNDPSHVQSELLQILRRREGQIWLLEREVERLRQRQQQQHRRERPRER